MAIRNDPFQEIDRLMGQVFGSARAAGIMPMDLYRSGDHYVLNVDLPGADPGTIDVGVDDRTLTICAERTSGTQHDVQWLKQERPSGTYVRQLTVGSGLALDRIDATYADGVLTLSIPIAEEPRPRKVEVQLGTSTGSKAQINSSSKARR